MYKNYVTTTRVEIIEIRKEGDYCRNCSYNDFTQRPITEEKKIMRKNDDLVKFPI